MSRKYIRPCSCTFATAVTIVAALAFSADGAAASGSSKHYGITITTAATRHVSFQNGVYQPTAEQATLNITDLQNALAAGNVEVTTGNGAGGAEAGDLHVEVAPFSWTSSHGLTLDAFHSIFVDEPINDAGSGALTLTTNDGGSGGGFVYGAGASISFASLSNVLTINGQLYKLIGTIKALAAGIAANPSGNYALAINISSGKYNRSPIPTTLNGIVNGLGNAISGLSVDDSTKLDSVGFFAGIGPTGVVQDLHLGIGIQVIEPQFAGGLAGTNQGQLIDDSVQSTVKTTFSASATLGGLVGANSGTITRCNASTKINAVSQSSLGGLVGSDSGGVISESFAAGSLTAGDTSAVGGLVGSTALTSISNAYATASTSSTNGDAGGLVGVNGNTEGNAGLIAASYATGLVNTKKHIVTSAGGLIGIDNSAAGSIADAYWDTTTSGIANLSQGAFSPANDPGIAGENSTQLASALPSGFDPTIWTEDTSINSGLPYLIANPPPQ